MQSLGRSLRSELGEFCIPVCLAAPIGSEEPLPSAEPTAVPPPSPPSGLMGSLTGLGRAKPTLSEYARHVVSGMLEGAPYAALTESQILRSLASHAVRLLTLPLSASQLYSRAWRRRHPLLQSSGWRKVLLRRDLRLRQPHPCDYGAACADDADGARAWLGIDQSATCEFCLAPANASAPASSPIAEGNELYLELHLVLYLGCAAFVAGHGHAHSLERGRRALVAWQYAQEDGQE